MSISLIKQTDLIEIVGLIGIVRGPAEHGCRCFAGQNGDVGPVVGLKTFVVFDKSKIICEFNKMSAIIMNSNTVVG